ncbi:hypothetical protein ACP70R_016872 [Stipagrostis hirtigluma subsp. patula]
MDGAVLAAAAASIGTMLQGWDYQSIAAASFYITKEFNLQSMPAMQGAILVIGFVSAITVTIFSDVLADRFGRWWMLFSSAVSFFVSAVFMPLILNVYMLLFMRAITGLGMGLAAAIVPLYISEITPTGKTGWLNTFPQISSAGGMILSYCMVFCIPQMQCAEWRIMLAMQSIPSLISIVLIFLYLPESPKWLVSQGRVDEAKQVLQRLRAMEDVNREMALLIEGTGGGQTPYMEEYLIGPTETTTDDELVADEEMMKLYGLEEDFCCVAYQVKGQSTVPVLCPLSMQDYL